MLGRMHILMPLRRLEPNDISVLRYVAGSTIAMAVALAFNWNLSYLLPVLSLGYFAPGVKAPTFKQGVSFVGTLIISTSLTFLFTKVFLEYLWVFIPVLALALLHVYYTNKLAATNKLFVLMSLLLIPMLGLISIDVAFIVAQSLIVVAVLTMVLVWTVHAIIPSINSIENSTKSKPAVKVPTSKERLTNALNNLIVVFPVVLVFFFFQWASGLLILIFIAILSMQPSFNFKAGFFLILGNLVGGIIAILMYETLVIVPKFSFMILVIILAGLYFAVKLYSGKKAAPLYGMAFSTLLLIIGQATTGTSDAGDKVWIRVLQIMVAVIYVVLAFATLHFFQERRLNRKIKNSTQKSG